MTFPNHVKFYIVGGYCRDRLLGRECKDHDFVVVGATPQMMLENNFKQVGADFPVFLNENGDEFALARTERKVGAGYHGFETDFNPEVTLEEDLKRRDVTVNSMAREVLSWNNLGHATLSDEIIDPFNGRKDLADRVLRHTSDAFGDDPVRVLRVARFAARYGFRISVDTFKLMKWMVRDGELDHLTVERVWQEFEKTMNESAGTHDFLHTLKLIGALEVLMPEIVDNLSAHEDVLDEADSLDESVAVKCAMITSHMDMQAVSDFWKRLKAPNDVIWLSISSSMVRRLLGQTPDHTPEQTLSLLKAINAYNNVNGMVDVLRVVSAVKPAWADRTQSISTCQWITKDISFGSLTKDQQSTLKGKEIGEAIDSLRIAQINFYSRLFAD